MARLYLLRHGTGEARVASSFDVSADDVKRSYANTRIHSSFSLPTVNGEDGPASDVSNPQVAVVELLRGEVAFGNFRSPGFNLLLDVDPIDAHNRLVKNVS
jgi:hypothetical protein